MAIMHSCYARLCLAARLVSPALSFLSLWLVVVLGHGCSAAEFKQ